MRDWKGERRLRVLEVGAGTGSATSVVLPELPAECDYTFTDISAGFFAEAEGRFSGSEIPIEYRPLDIEKDPSNQGFEPHAYDLIIAANVLHATRDLGETLTHCLELLAPSGQLMALENMRGRGWQDITFGLLDGWWRFADDYRPAHAMAHPSIWRRALLDSGYDEVGFLGTEGADEGGPFGSSVILAQGPAEITQSPGLWVISSDAGGMGLQLARELASRNQTVVLAESSQPSETPVREGNIVRKAVAADSRESWQALLEELPKDIPLQGVLHLNALDGHGHAGFHGPAPGGYDRRREQRPGVGAEHTGCRCCSGKRSLVCNVRCAGPGARLHARERRRAGRGHPVGLRQSGCAGSGAPSPTDCWTSTPPFPRRLPIWPMS